MTHLANLHRIEVTDILRELPDIQPLDVAHHMTGKTDDLFLTALGFEDRCPWIPELLATEGRQYRANRAIYFEYNTNQADNELNRPRLIKAMGSFAAQVRPMPCETDDFASQLRGVLSDICTKPVPPQVTFDVSVCSSRLLITALTVLFEYPLKLTVVYSEARTYHPTETEYYADPQRWTSDDQLGLARGVSSVSRSPDHPGSRRDGLPEAVIVFPTFKPERIRAILTDVDESLLMRPENRIVWLIGKPRLPVDHWRTGVQRTINSIPESAPAHEVCTFDYKKTLEILDRVYQPLDCKFLVSIAPLGSKMQSLGAVLFWIVRPEVSIYFASPREYNAAQYSEGCKATWWIEFGSLVDVRKLLTSVGELRVAE